MSFFERCRNFTVKVNGGSGVIFQPMTKDYTYVLTAKHNLYKDTEAMQNALDDTSIDAIGIDINFIEKYEHNSLDIAILKIEKIDIETPLKEFEEVSKDNAYELYGYPKYKREESENIEEQIENFEVNFSKNNDYTITFDDPKFTGVEGIKGVSGGGVFREDGESIYLVAIEYEMNAKKDSEATHQRIDTVCIEAFGKIIENNNLAKLMSPNLNNFSHYKDDLIKVFPKEVKNLLSDEVDDILSKDVNPYKIIENLEEKLIYPKTSLYKNYIHDKELWQGWLFYLALINIYLDRKHNVDDFIKLDNKNIYCLFCNSDENNINEMISNILRDSSDFTKNSTILFNTKNNISNKDYCYYSKNIPQDISNVYSLNDDDKMMINKVNKQKKISFILLNNIKQGIVNIDISTRNEIKKVIKKDLLCKRSILTKIQNSLGIE